MSFSLPIPPLGEHSPVETLEWSVRWMGVRSGRVWARLFQLPEGEWIEAGCDTSGVAERMYPVHDKLWSLWRPGEGARRYLLSQREARLIQDTHIELGDTEFVVRRSARRDAGWTTTERALPAAPQVEDPASAIMRLRREPVPASGVVRFPVFTGHRTIDMVGRRAGWEVLQGRRCARMEVTTEVGEESKARFVLCVSEDAQRLPLRWEIPTRAGAVLAELTHHTRSPR